MARDRRLLRLLATSRPTKAHRNQHIALKRDHGAAGELNQPVTIASGEKLCLAQSVNSKKHWRKTCPKHSPRCWLSSSP
jgi:hypothetical protein